MRNSSHSASSLRSFSITGDSTSGAATAHYTFFHRMWPTGNDYKVSPIRDDCHRCHPFRIYFWMIRDPVTGKMHRSRRRMTEEDAARYPARFEWNKTV